MLAQRLALIFRITRIAELVKVLGIVTIVASMSVIPTYAQSQSRVASPVGSPRLPHFNTLPTDVNNRPRTSLASTENLNVTEPLPGLPTSYKVTFREFMGYLQESNINYAAQRFNISIAQAQLKAARTYPDPTFQSGYAGESTRSDLIAASTALETACAQYRLAQVNRIPDLTIGGVYQHLTRVTNHIDPSPAWDSAGLTLSIPLPFSNLNDGNLQAANYTQLQAGVALQATKLQAQADVRIAYERYVLAVVAVKDFEIEILHDADKVYKSRLFKLEEGQNSLVDVLSAHATINQIYVDYYNALGEQAKALVALESSAGIWDIDF